MLRSNSKTKSKLWGENLIHYSLTIYYYELLRSLPLLGRNLYILFSQFDWIYMGVIYVRLAKQFVSALFLSHLVCFRICLTQFCLPDSWCLTDFIEEYRWNITSILNFENWKFINWNFEIWYFLLSEKGSVDISKLVNLIDEQSRSICPYLELRQICSFLSFKNRQIFKREIWLIWTYI